MCVTNTTHSRVQAVSLTPAQAGVSPSMLSQRLMGTFGCGFPAATSSVPVFPLAQPISSELIQTVPSTKSRPKRRRKPQKPGKTAKLNERHFVKHDYHDHANDADDEAEDMSEEAVQRRRGGVAIAFPLKLHAVLLQVETDLVSNVVSWQPHGRCFVIHKPKEFVDLVMPKYFRQTKLTSFQRQLNLYGFQRLTRGNDAGGYYHECFLRGKEFLCKKMTRTKVKGTRFKAASSPEMEPDFYTMRPVTVTPPTSSDEEMSFDSRREAEQSFPVYACDPASEPQLFSFANLSPPLLQVSVSPMTSAATASYAYMNPAMCNMEADRILDEAVDELFLTEAGDVDNLADFVHDWDPSINFGAILQDDAQLGFMLDKLLAD